LPFRKGGWGLGEGDEQGQEEGSIAQRVGSPKRGQQRLKRGHQNSRRRITKKGWQSSRRTTTRKGMSKGGGGGGGQSARGRITKKWTTKTKNKVAELKEEDHQEVDD